jgi:hypothetical protein
MNSRSPLFWPERNVISWEFDYGSQCYWNFKGWGIRSTCKAFWDAVGSTPSSVLLIDDQLRVVAVNRNFLEKNRKSREGALGVRLHNLLPEPLIENMDITARVRQVFDQNIKSFGGRMTYRAPGAPLRVYYYSLLSFTWLGHRFKTWRCSWRT